LYYCVRFERLLNFSCFIGSLGKTRFQVQDENAASTSDMFVAAGGAAGERRRDSINAAGGGLLPGPPSTASSMSSPAKGGSAASSPAKKRGGAMFDLRDGSESKEDAEVSVFSGFFCLVAYTGCHRVLEMMRRS
jgi:hypothetical protein